MKTEKRITICVVIVAALSMMYSFTGRQQIQADVRLQQKPWIVPEASKKEKNPTKNTAENINVGKSLYGKHCKSCHGKNGEGDGPKAAELKTSAGDFTTPEFQQETDGELYYKITEGRDDMPGFRKKIASDEDRWLIVHYLRTLKP